MDQHREAEARISEYSQAPNLATQGGAYIAEGVFLVGLEEELPLW